jgi:CheY-like chemotaxis protein
LGAALRCLRLISTGVAYGMTSAERNRVLVVEDEPIIRRCLEEGLIDAGFSVITAHNGAVAIDRVRQHRPDAVLLDLLMPVMDGLAFLRERQHQPLLAALPVVVLSAGGLTALRDAVALRATAALAKPVDLDVLSAVLDHVLRDFGREPIEPLGPEEPLREPVGSCPICGRTAYAILNLGLRPTERLSQIYAARRTHVMSHTAADLVHEPMRRRLLQLPVDRRRILANWMFHDMRQDWGDRDRRGIFSIDEVLQATALRDLWHEATACGAPTCRHT